MANSFQERLKKVTCENKLVSGALGNLPVETDQERLKKLMGNRFFSSALGRIAASGAFQERVEDVT
jgi:hypothetical protein